jgi:hypothetical protein
MSVFDAISSSVSTALDSIINTRMFYRDNSLTPIQAGIILLLPQITAFLLQYNKEFGIKFEMQLENYPLLLFVFLVVMVFVLIEPEITQKSGEEISKIAFLSIHLFAFALSLNLIYAVVVPLFGYRYDPLAAQVANFATYWQKPLQPTQFAMLYGVIFLLVAIFLVALNSWRQYQEDHRRNVLKTPLFWRSSLLAMLLAFYQYAIFILIGKSALPA